jgi:hypothetical protein
MTFLAEAALQTWARPDLQLLLLTTGGLMSALSLVFFCIDELMY